ncbi:MAG: hypothetical protein ACP5IE_00750, partial [Infirmifilum sp.]
QSQQPHSPPPKHMDVIEDILRKIPRPNYSEMPQLYEEIDNMTRAIFNREKPANRNIKTQPPKNT